MRILVTTTGGIEKYELVKYLENHPKVTFVLAADAVENHITKQYKNFTTMPFATDEEEYLNALELLISRYEIEGVFSIDTHESILIAQNAERLGIKHAASDHLNFDLHLNKHSYLTLMGQNALRLCSTDPRMNVSAFAEFTAINRNYSKFVIKPNNSHGSRGLRIVDMAYDQKNYQNSRDSYSIDFEFACRHIISDSYDMIIQPFYGGQNYNVDCYRDVNGKIHMVAQKILGNRWGQVLGSQILTENDPEYSSIEKWANFIAINLQLNKNFNFEVSDDGLGSLELVEVNPRISAVFPQSVHSGVDLINLTLMEMFPTEYSQESIDQIYALNTKSKIVQSVLLTL